jgi:TPR repeat protein
MSLQYLLSNIFIRQRPEGESGKNFLRKRVEYKMRFPGVVFAFILFIFLSIFLSIFAEPFAFAAQPPVTPEQAFSRTLFEAEKGSVQALITLGGFYAEGVGVQKNYSKARECYEKAAQSGMAEGVYNVGVCWEFGMGSEANLARAAEYFRKAADMGLPQALFKMSVILDAGSGVNRDEKASIDYMARAAEAGHSDAAAIMGLVYLNGLRGQKKDAVKGLKLLEAAASSGSVESMKNMAVVYKDGMGGVKASPPDALRWYITAEKCGYPAEALSAVTAELRKKVSGKQQKDAESAAEAWIKNARFLRRSGK